MERDVVTNHLQRRVAEDSLKAQKVADEPEAIEDLAVPQVAPDKFIPVAWATKGRKAIKAAAVPVKQ